MNSLAFSAFVTSALSLLLGGLVFFRKTKDNITLSYSGLTVSFFVWIFGIGMEIGSPDKESGLFWNRWLYSGAIFIPSFFLYFIQSYLGRTKRALLILSFTISVIFLLFNFTPLFVKDAVPKGSFNYASVPGIIFPFFVLYFFITILYSSKLVIESFRKSIGIQREQLKFVLLAYVIGFLGGSTNFLLVFDVLDAPPVGNYFIGLYLLILFYAIVRHRLMDINIVLKRGTTYVLLILLLFVPSLLIVLLTQKLFFKEVNSLFSVIHIGLLFLVAVFFYKIKPGAEKAVEQILFKTHYRYHDALNTFSKALVTILDLQSLSKQIIETITQTMGVQKASVYILREDKGGYCLSDSRNVEVSASNRILPREDPLPAYLQNTGEIVIREELMKALHPPGASGICQRLSSLEAEVSIPLILKGRLLGLINLSHKFTREIYSQEDIQLLTTLANQTAIACENARLYGDLKESKSYIRRADRLASLGTLTAGLAHEIRNPLVAIKTFTQLLPERFDDEEFRQQFLPIASGEVDRISILVDELLNFAKPSDPKLETEDINTVLDGMILLVSTESKKKAIELVKEYGADLPSVTIDRDQMKQVFLNILLNAVEATPEGGHVTVRTRSYTKAAGDAYVQIEFTDTGGGIPEECLEEIFNPFFSTKTKGSGLGLSISAQIVQDHRGYIDVESRVDQGASFFVNLPITLEHPKRRKNDMEPNARDMSAFEPL
jgi:signal transduction histidine kinase